MGFGEHKRSYIYYSVMSIVIAVIFLLQTSTGIIPTVFGVKPNPAFILLILFAMFGGEWAGILGGLALGAATDVISAAPDGFNALFMMLVGLVSALLSIYLFNRRLPAAMVLTGLGAAVYYFVLWLVTVVPQGYCGAGLYLVRYSLPQAIYSFLFVFPFWWLLDFASRPRKKRNNRGLLE